MKQLLISLILIILVISACKKEEKPVMFNYLIDITGVSKDTVRVNDTLSIYVRWLNSAKTDLVKVSFDKIPAKVIGLKNDTTILVIVPSKWTFGTLKLEHPNGAIDFWSEMHKENFPQILSISPIIGKANDIITIKGQEFLAAQNIGVRINTLDCEIIELSDSLIRFKVPTGCGNGLIRILYGGSNVSCHPDTVVEIGMFKYNFQAISKRRVKKYSDFGQNYLLERNGTGWVSKRIFLNSDGTQANKYDKFIYNTNGLIDTIVSYNDGTVKTYKVYSRNHDGSILETVQYNNNMVFVEKYEYHYLNGNLAQLIYYQQPNWLRFVNNYSYTSNKENLTRTFYTSSGGIDFVWKYENIEFDTNNGNLPDLGIPGYEKLDIYPYRQFEDQGWGSSYRYENFYNEYGELILIKRYDWCKFDMNSHSYEYE